MHEEDDNNILKQVGDDPFVRGAWFFTVVWFVIRLIALAVMFIYVMCTCIAR